MAGSIRVAGHTIAEHDIVNDKVDIKNATLGSSVTFPAGILTDYDLQVINSNITAATSNNTPDIAGSTAVSITLPASSSAIISASGGKLFGSSGTSRALSVALISYTTDGTTPSSSSNLIYGGEATYVSPSGTAYFPGIVEGKVDNATSSNITLKWNWGVVATSSVGNAQWTAETNSVGGRADIILKTLIFKN